MLFFQKETEKNELVARPGAPVPVAPERLAVENHVVQKTVFVVEFHDYRERLLAATESGTVFH